LVVERHLDHRDDGVVVVGVVLGERDRDVDLLALVLAGAVDVLLEQLDYPLVVALQRLLEDGAVGVAVLAQLLQQFGLVDLDGSHWRSPILLWTRSIRNTTSGWAGSRPSASANAMRSPSTSSNSDQSASGTAASGSRRI